MKHTPILDLSQTTLRAKHADLLQDVEAVAARANAAKRAPHEYAAMIVEAAEVTHVRVLAGWRASRGGHAANNFFDPLSKRLRRIIREYRKFCQTAPVEPVEGQRFIYQIINYEELPLDRLKPYFRASHIDAAIKEGIGLGLREIPGLRIYPDEETD